MRQAARERAGKRVDKIHVLVPASVRLVDCQVTRLYAGCGVALGFIHQRREFWELLA
jgi:hypothetical protein